MLNISLPKDDMSSDNMVYIITIKLLCKRFFSYESQTFNVLTF